MRLVRILFPGAGLLVLSAWCLGVLNSHRRFFLSYAAPVVWNLAIIVALIVGGGRADERRRWPRSRPWGSVVGQRAAVRGAAADGPAAAAAVPAAPRSTAQPDVRRCSGNFGAGVRGPGRGADQRLRGHACSASLLRHRRGGGLAHAQVLYTLPVSLFGMSVSAAELPAMSERHRDRGGDRSGAARSGWSRGSGDRVLRGALGRGVPGPRRRRRRRAVPDRTFTRRMTAVRLGHPGGLAPSGCSPPRMGRLYTSAFYALRDTRTPLRFAMIRVALTTALGYRLPPCRSRAAGIDAALGRGRAHGRIGRLAGWVEFLAAARARSTGPDRGDRLAGRRCWPRLWAGGRLLGAALGGCGAWCCSPACTRSLRAGAGADRRSEPCISVLTDRLGVAGGARPAPADGVRR